MYASKMNEKTPLSALSDAEFIARLKKGEKYSNWTMGQLDEYERRGPDFLANDEGLRENIETTLKNHYDKMRLIFEPTRKYWDAKNAEILRKLPKFSFPIPTLPDFSFPIPTLPALIEETPSLADEVIESNVVEEATQAAMFKALLSNSSYLPVIAANTRFDWKGKTNLVASLVAASTGVVAIVINLLR
jgi:hypothetical protein